MDKLKQWVALTVVACLALAAAGWFLVVSPKRSDAASLRQQAAEQAGKNEQAKMRLQVLQAQAKDLPKEQAKLAAVASKIPDNPALPGLIRTLLDAATSSGVELVSITPGQPTALKAAAASTAAPVKKPTGSADTTPGAAPAAGPATDTAAQAGDLSAINVSLNVVGDFFEVQQFVAAVEDLPRSFRVSNLQVAPGASPTDKTGGDAAVKSGRSLTATVQGQVYMAVNRPAALAATVPAGSAPASTTAAAPAK